MLAVAGSASILGAVCAAALFVLEDHLPAEGLLLPTLIVFAFALGWWLLAALFVVGVVLGIRSSDRRPQIVWAMITAAAFTVAAVLLATVGMFPWPFAPAFN